MLEVPMTRLPKVSSERDGDAAEQPHAGKPARGVQPVRCLAELHKRAGRAHGANFSRHASIARMPSATRGPGRTMVSRISGGKEHTRRFLHGADSIPARPLGQVRRLRCRNDNDVRIVAHDILGIEHGERTQVRRHDVARAEPGKHLTDEGCGARGVRRAVDFEIHRRYRRRGDSPAPLSLTARTSAIDFPIERRRARSVAQDLRRSGSTVRAMSAKLSVSSATDCTPSSRSRSVIRCERLIEHHIGPQAHDLLDLRHRRGRRPSAATGPPRGQSE